MRGEEEEEEVEECLYWPVKYSSNEAGAGREVEMEKSPQENEQHIFLRHMGTAEHRGDTETKEGKKSFQCASACKVPRLPRNVPSTEQRVGRRLIVSWNFIWSFKVIAGIVSFAPEAVPYFLFYCQ